jgi:hypothetical protein
LKIQKGKEVRQMKTIGDLRKFISTSHVDRNLFGSTDKLDRSFSRRCQAVGWAICRERNITLYAGKKLPPETELGEESRKLAKSLKTWFSRETAIKR